MGNENCSSFGSLSPEQKRIEEEREMFSNEFENRAEMRNEIEKQKQTLWEKMKFWQSPPGVTMLDIAHEEALVMNERIDRAVDELSERKQKTFSDERLGELRQHGANHLVQTEYGIKGPDQIRSEEEYNSLKHDILESLLDNDFDSAASLYREKRNLLNRDKKGTTESAAAERTAEIGSIHEEKVASLILNQDAEALIDYYDADMDSGGCLGGLRHMDLLNLPGVTPEMLHTPEMKKALLHIVATQLGRYKNPSNLNSPLFDTVKSWKDHFVSSGFVTEDEIRTLPVFKKVAINWIKYLGKSIKDRHSGINTAPAFISALQKWTELGALSETEAYELERKYLP